ncbi:uncharacterized protein LAESUDRAFT_762318 [Laetiporus sulphureus 93-53]|uniref:DOC domain-containing protein n=1 Tax=Laetiporus sulphureus 93-53 TaxID=1314785 RepID=A0A165CIT1_9APHY|nr:uncharacterized protein LAESUDRAFT_762318 [Laetiporus sulphureus 93-53]KZT02886.1 hypothetical protein LAESUDRAFT_762318 [Laetiporus sulphureus 93-53]
MTSVSTAGPIGINHFAYPSADGTPIMHAGRKSPFLPWPDIGHLTKWSVSSYKFGFGPECLRDDDPDTFCNGPPTALHHGRISSQSSHPSAELSRSANNPTIAVLAGTGLHDLQDVQAIHLDKPDGWTTFDASAEPSPDGANGLSVRLAICGSDNRVLICGPVYQ